LRATTASRSSSPGTAMRLNFMSGASDVVYGIRLLQLLRDL